LRVLRISDSYPGQTLRLIMNGEIGRAAGFLVNTQE